MKGHVCFWSTTIDYRLDEHVSGGGKSMIDLNLPLSLLASVWALRLVTMSCVITEATWSTPRCQVPTLLPLKRSVQPVVESGLRQEVIFIWGCVMLVFGSSQVWHFVTGNPRNMGHFCVFLSKKNDQTWVFCFVFSFFKWRFIILVSQWVNQHVFF